MFLFAVATKCYIRFLVHSANESTPDAEVNRILPEKETNCRPSDNFRMLVAIVLAVECDPGEKQLLQTHSVLFRLCRSHSLERRTFHELYQHNDLIST
jgi:hypothetical protein